MPILFILILNLKLLNECFVNNIFNKLDGLNWFLCFNEISNLCMLFNPKTILLEEQSWYHLTHSCKDKGVHTFPEGICLKVNVIARLEFELAYYDSAVHRFNHYTTRTPANKPELISLLTIKWFVLVWFIGISTIVGYLMLNPCLYIYIYIYIYIWFVNTCG